MSTMEEISERLIGAYKNGNFLTELSALYSAGKQPYREEVGGLLARIHNNGGINIVAEFSSLVKADNPNIFFNVRDAFQQALPNLIAEVKPVMSCVRNLTSEAGDDLSAGWIIPPFIKYLQSSAERPMQAIEIELESPNVEVNLVCPAIIAGSGIDFDQYCHKAIELVSNGNEYISSNAIFALGRIDFKNDKELALKSILALDKKVAQDKNAKILGSCLKSASKFYVKFPEYKERLIELIKKTTAAQDDFICHAATEVLFFDKDGLDSEIIDVLLDFCLGINPINLGSLNNLDYGVAHIFRSGNPYRAVCFVEEYIAKSSDSDLINNFDDFLRELILHKDEFNRLVTRWLVSDQVSLPAAVLNICNKIGREELTLGADFSGVEGDCEDILYSGCKRACGWLFTMPVAAVSFMVSVLEICSEHDREEIKEIIFNPLLISYPGMLKGYLESISESISENTREIVDSLLSDLNLYQDGLKGAWDIKELAPSISQRESYSRYHSEIMNKAMEDRPPGFLSSLFTPSVLLYGSSSIHHVYHGPQQDKTRQEVKLQKISHSFEFPRLQMIDPHGLDHMLRVFRCERIRS